MTQALLFTETEAAEAMKLCTRTLRKARQAGQLTYILHGRAVRYTLADLNSFIDSLRREEKPSPSIKPKSHPSGSTTSGGTVIAFSDRPSARMNARR